jgi:branched-chain amino acid transport system substrate-binding protein
MRAADNQLVLPNFVGRVKAVDGVLRPVVEQRFEASLTPAPSPLCTM